MLMQVFGCHPGSGQDPSSGRDLRAIGCGAQSRGLAAGLAARPDQLEGPLGEVRLRLLHNGVYHRDHHFALFQRVRLQVAWSK